MTHDPTVDGRNRDALRERAESLAKSYVGEWNPDASGSGAAMLSLFAELAEEVVERLDHVPEKHRVSFFDTLGFSRAPPQASRVPLSVRPAEGVARNVPVPAGTEAVAAATDTRPEQIFQVAPRDGFEVTPAPLDRLYAVEPGTDQIVDHRSLLENGRETDLFRGEDQQMHALHFGDDEILNLTPAAVIQVRLRTTVPRAELKKRLVWQYYGTKGDGEKAWHPFPAQASVSGEAREAGAGDHPVTGDATYSEPGEAFANNVKDRLERRGYTANEWLSPRDKRRIHERIATEVTEREFRKFRSDGRDEDELAASIARNLLPSAAVDQGLVEEIAMELRAIKGVHASVGDAFADGGEVGAGTRYERTSFNLRLPVDGVITPHEIDGVTSRWIRCIPKRLFTVDVTSVELGATTDKLSPDALLTNDVPLPVESDEMVLPFGDTPRTRDEFYVASAEAFSTGGTPVTITFEGDESDTPGAGGTITARLSWEYWNGESWQRIQDIDHTDDATKRLTGAGSVKFEVPTDLEPISVAGRENHWIRIRLAGGDYGERLVTEENGIRYEIRGIAPPMFDELKIAYSSKSPHDFPEHVVTYNNLAYNRVRSEQLVDGFSPFVGVSDGSQTLYVGFDGPLRDGPIPLYVAMADKPYARDFHPRIRWEYCVDPAGDEWAAIDVRDSTKSLTRRGIVRLVFPTDTTAFERFGEQRHWIRARVRGKEFGYAETLFRPALDDADETSECTPDPCRTRVRSAAALRGPVETPPTLRGLYPNTGWAYNVRTVEDELLGRSDGTPSQSFTVVNPPARNMTVWVDELSKLSAGERTKLERDQPDDVEAVTDPRGDVQTFWVRWQQVDHRLASRSDDRHFEVDQTDGTIKFGDGEQGAIPPVGDVRASYETGGGRDGNVEAHTVNELKSSLPYVDTVTNPDVADGGANAESMSQALTNASKQLRDRGRAVTAADVERLAMTASRKLTRVKCIPRLDRYGRRTLGWVTVLIVPESGDRTPSPSSTLVERVTSFLETRAPATLVSCEHLVVRGPSFVEVAVTATVAPEDIESISQLEEAAIARIEAFLHPLTGGDDGTGWDFGELPCLSDFYALLEGLEGVDHVTALSVTVEGFEQLVRMTEDIPPPQTSPDILVCSGTHDIDATGGT